MVVPNCGAIAVLAPGRLSLGQVSRLHRDRQGSQQERPGKAQHGAGRIITGNISYLVSASQFSGIDAAPVMCTLLLQLGCSQVSRFHSHYSLSSLVTFIFNTPFLCPDRFALLALSVLFFIVDSHHSWPLSRLLGSNVHVLFVAP